MQLHIAVKRRKVLRLEQSIEEYTTWHTGKCYVICEHDEWAVSRLDLFFGGADLQRRS